VNNGIVCPGVFISWICNGLVTTEGGVMRLGTGMLPRLLHARAFAGIHSGQGGRTPKPQGISMPVTSCGDCYTQQRGLMNKHPVRCSPAVHPGEGADWVTLGAHLFSRVSGLDASSP
jgi:hypothetical protein